VSAFDVDFGLACEHCLSLLPEETT